MDCRSMKATGAFKGYLHIPMYHSSISTTDHSEDHHGCISSLTGNSISIFISDVVYAKLYS